MFIPFIKENSGLLLAIKAHCIFDVINSEEFKKQAKPLLEKHHLNKISDKRAHAYDFAS